MQLTEAEIKELFTKHSLTIKHGSAYLKVLNRAQFMKAARDIAQAEAEKMQEEVLWEGPGRIGKYCNIELLSGISGEEYGLFQPWPRGKIEQTIMGQLVTVVVSKKEEK